MSPLEEHYQLLDAPPTATLKEIRLIYRDLAQVWHPDRFQENPRLREKAEAKLKAINHAYETIRKSRQASGPSTPKPSPPKRRPGPPARRDLIPAAEADALGWYAKTAIDGHADAQCIIATMYAEGDQVARDETKATYWFRQSAAQGHPAAEFQMGLRHFSGSGVTKDPQKAFDYYQRAALHGHSKAQFSLGILFTNGAHIRRDEIEAFAWFTIAAEAGHADAATLRESVEQTLDDSKRQQAIEHTAKLRQRIAV